MQHLDSSSRPTKPDYSGLWIPLVTPFKADGAVDHDSLAALTRRLARQGISGVVVCGSTGEAAALDDAEQHAVLDTVAKAVPTLPRIMGVSGSHLGQVIDKVRRFGEVSRLAKASLVGVLVSAPSYVRPSQAGLIDWFTRIADASPAPVLLYDIPYRTGSTIATDTLLTLAAHPNIHALKDCGGDASKTRALIADGRLQVLAGEDAQIFATMAEGGVGAIAATAHLETERFIVLIEALRQGRLVDARATWQRLVPLIETMFAEPNPGPLKSALAIQGELQNVLRSPMTPASVATRDALAVLLNRP